MGINARAGAFLVLDANGGGDALHFDALIAQSSQVPAVHGYRCIPPVQTSTVGGPWKGKRPSCSGW